MGNNGRWFDSAAERRELDVPDRVNDVPLRTRKKDKRASIKKAHILERKPLRRDTGINYERDNLPSLARAIREQVCLHPGRSAAKIVEKLKERGYETSLVTVGQIRTDVRATLRVLSDLGML